MQCIACGCGLNVHQRARGRYCDRFECRSIAAKRWYEKQHAEAKAAEAAVARAHFQALLSRRPELRARDPYLLQLTGLDAAIEPVPEALRQSFSRHLRQVVADCAAGGNAMFDVPGTEDLESSAGTASSADAPAITGQVDLPRPSAAGVCATCRGYCCRLGGSRAFIDQRTIARVQSQWPDLSEEGLVAAYLDALPARHAAGSCVYHGAGGCALPRDLRSNVCNDYFCEPVLEWFVHRRQRPGVPVAVVVLQDMSVTRSAVMEHA
jgi:hypothetical protein